MSRHQKWVIGFALCVLALWAGMSYYFPTKGVEIGHGWRMEFVAASVDRMVYNSESTLGTRVKNAIPMGLQILMEMQPLVSVHDESDGALFLLFIEYSPAHLKPTPESLPHPRLEIVDENGVVYPVSRQQGISSSGNARQHGMLYTSEAFPRRQPTLHFRLLSDDGTETLMEQTIPNPGYQPTFPEWVAPPCPVTQTVGPLTVTLTDIQVDNVAQQLKPQFSLRSNSPGWDVLHVDREFDEFSDATGNRGSWLPLCEPAWKLKTQFRRRINAQFAPEETWNLGSFPIPASATSASLQTITARTINSVLIQPQHLMGPGCYRFEKGQLVSATVNITSSGGPKSYVYGDANFMDIQTDFPALYLEPGSLPLLTHLDVRISDQNGNNLSPIRDIVDYGWVGWYAFQPRSDSTSLQIEIVVHQCLEFEFVVKPPVVASNDRE